MQGVSLPAIHVMLSKWAPAKERNVIASLTYAGKLKILKMFVIKVNYQAPIIKFEIIREFYSSFSTEYDQIIILIINLRTP